ncbi:MAG: GPW/gp25 family protein [Rhodocyclaceae bacterium]|nr:GPW/gp25 family protein [Rhodocyclaceae bacterium]
MDAETGRPLDGIDHLKQSIRDILTTRIGTRVMRREYGSRVPDLVDRPITPALAAELYAAVAEALDAWEPRFALERVGVIDARAGRVALRLEGLYRPEGRRIALETTL